jgi:hypothetical protein
MSSVAPDPDLLEQAKQLENQAMEQGEETSAGRQLRANAAALRVQALGQRSYPLLICESCFKVTGWLSGDQHCDGCLRREQLQAAYHDPHGGWVVPDNRVPAAAPTSKEGSTRNRIGALRHPHEARNEALASAWMAHVRPDETGPIAPEDGYKVEVAKREELEAADRSGMVVRFHAASHQFHDGRWVELPSTRIPRRDILVPTEFSAGLPVEQIVDAWGDYKAAVDVFNRRTWDTLSEQQETQRQVADTHTDTIREQRDVLELLDEGS